jgi:hypothetical protein
MKKTLAAAICWIVLDLAGPRWPPLVMDIAGPWWPRGGVAMAAAADQPADSQAATNLVDDYRAVRKVGLALAVIGFMVAMIRLGMSEFPAERHRAETLAGLTAVVFVLLAVDRMIARGVAEWFNLSASSLPPFWR